MTETKELTLFERLFEQDVSSYIEKKKVKTKKGDEFTLDYLSWAFAHAEMKKIDPDAKVIEREFTHYRLLGEHLIEEQKPWLADQAGAMVNVTVKMLGREENEWLYVMDNSNQSVSEPNAAQINKTLKRCFVKALAKFGLGLSLYIGEDTKAAADKKLEPMTLERALSYTITFGKHNGKTLDAINKEESSYIKWLANGDKTKPEVKEAAKMILNPTEKTVEEPSEQKPNEQNPKEDDFSTKKKEIEDRIHALATKTGGTFEKIKAYVIDCSNQQMHKEFDDFNSSNLPSSMGYVKVLETKANNQPETKQGAILDGMTSKPVQTVDWGNR